MLAHTFLSHFNREKWVWVYFVLRYAQLNFQTHPYAVSTAIFFLISLYWISISCWSLLQFEFTSLPMDSVSYFDWHFNPCVTNYSPLDTLLWHKKIEIFQKWIQFVLWKKIVRFIEIKFQFNNSKITVIVVQKV